MSELLFISDTHFGHGNIIKYCNRPFENRDEMNEVLIETWNRYVKPGDRVIHLGDFGFAPAAKIDELLTRLNGTKTLISGNHDDSRVRRSPGWTDVVSQMKFDIGAFKFICSHYPNWKKYDGWDIFLHGHCHATLEPTKNVLDVGVDMAYKLYGEFRPFTLDDIATELERIDGLFGEPKETTEV